MHESVKWVVQKKQNLQVRLRQQVYKSKTNYPFLSGDSFARACDFSTDARVQNSKTNLKFAKSIFCPSDKLEKFLEVNWDQISARVLVLGNGDRDFYEPPCDLPSSIQSVYIQNSHISDGIFKTLPIGLENLRYGRNGIPSLFKLPQDPIEKKEKVLVGPFSPTHFEREELNSWSNIRDSRLHFVSEQIPPKKLALLAPTFKFVACPRGNGTDTHRFWETLYRGSIPVVKESAWSKSIADLEIPLVQLQAWDFDEFIDMVGSFHQVKLDPSLIPILWMDHWEKLFSSNLEKFL